MSHPKSDVNFWKKILSKNVIGDFNFQVTDDLDTILEPQFYGEFKTYLLSKHV